MKMLAIDPTQWALFLDLDGTLIDIASSPQGVSTPPELVSILAGLLQRFAGAVAVVSGRSVADCDDLLKPLALVAAGVHGAEMRTTPSGPVVRTAPSMPDDILASAREVEKLAPGVFVEPKGAGIAVHFRKAPASAAAIERRLREIVRTGDHDLSISRGRMVFDLLPAACSKRHALSRLMALETFAGRRPLMIGDDYPDEGALDYARMQGGAGLRVAGEHFAIAQAEFRNPAQVRAWLAALAS
jgi:trehalose 6-phosphate phosphatase